jgi:hypothetical protein
MATPQMTFQIKQVTLQNDNPGSVRIDTFDAAGAPLDVSAGYIIQQIRLAPSSQANTLKNGIDESAEMTAVVDATGLTLTWTAAQATAMYNNLASLQNSGFVRLSNDAGATDSIAAALNVNLTTISAIA